MSLQRHLDRPEEILRAPPPAHAIDATGRLALGLASLKALRRHLLHRDLNETKDVHEAATREEHAV